MHPSLREALERRGWDTLFEELLPELGRASATGERTCNAPWIDFPDRGQHLSVNTLKGLWRCFKTNRRGNYIQLLQWLRAVETDEKGHLVPVDYKAIERELMVTFGLSRKVDLDWLNQCQSYLAAHPDVIARFARGKAWDLELLVKLGIGFDPELVPPRFVIPCCERTGNPVNCRLYNSESPAKLVWSQEGLADNFLFPRSGWNEEWVILVEGEPDVLTLRSVGFPGVSGTQGSSSPVPRGDWWRGKTVFILMDADRPGQEAQAKAVAHLLGRAETVRVCQLPEWPDRPTNADISDFVGYLYRQGATREAVAEAIREILADAEELQKDEAYLEEEPEPLAFRELVDAERLRQPVTARAKVVATGTAQFALPVTVALTCSGEAHAFCPSCPMRTQHDLHKELAVDSRSELGLRLVRVSDRDQLAVWKERVGIRPQCTSLQVEKLAHVNVIPAVLMSPSPDPVALVEGNDLPEAAADRKRRDAYIVGRGEALAVNRDYQFVGLNYADPKTQAVTLWLHKAEPVDAELSEFQMTSELREELAIFQPASASPEAVWEKLCRVADDLMAAVTLIRDRRDLHLAYRTVWHSVLAFPFRGTIERRGWIEALVIGDTRCGKSEAFSRLAGFYGVGLRVDCKNQSAAGILGACVQSTLTGEHMVIPGVMPQQDGRILCFDEFHCRTRDKETLISMLSSTRSEGLVRIAKVVYAEFPARVRAIYLANPGAGALLHELGGHGIEYIARLIPQPEDIARFDFGMAVSQEEVDKKRINQQEEPALPHYSQRASQQLLRWAWSRGVSRIFFHEAAVEAILALSERLYETYDAAIPLVEPSYQRMRVAKVALSVAAQCFSTDESGELLVVRTEHVAAAAWLFHTWYTKPAMGYDVFSASARANRSLRQPEEVARVFAEVDHPRRLAECLLETETFTARMFGTFVPMAQMQVAELLQRLQCHRAIRPASWSDRYEKTPAFVSWLRSYLGQQA